MRKHRRRAERPPRESPHPPPVLDLVLEAELVFDPHLHVATLRSGSPTCCCCGVIVQTGETIYWHERPDHREVPLCYHCGTSVALHAGKVNPYTGPYPNALASDTYAL